MTTSESGGDSMADFLADLSTAPSRDYPDWEDATDLGRLHIQAFTQSRAGQTDVNRSWGCLRLSGEAIRGHSLDMGMAALVLAEFQSLVTAAGASRSGITTEAGSLSNGLVDRTRLGLSPSIVGGVTVLKFEPAVTNPASKQDLAQGDLSLVEDSVDLAFRILDIASHPNPIAALKTLGGWGPRLATATKHFVQTTANAGLDLNATWERPSIGRKRVELTAADSDRFLRLLDKHHPIGRQILRGTLRHVSPARTVDLEVRGLESDPARDSQIIVINPGSADFGPFGPGDELSVVVEIRRVLLPGVGEVSEYTATGVERIGEEVVDDGASHGGIRGVVEGVKRRARQATDSVSGFVEGVSGLVDDMRALVEIEREAARNDPHAESLLQKLKDFEGTKGKLAARAAEADSAAGRLGWTPAESTSAEATKEPRKRTT